MKNHVKLTLLLAGAMVLAAPVLRAEEPAAPSTDKPGRQERRHERREEMRDQVKQMAQELNLTDDQQAKIKAIHEQTRGARQALAKDESLTRDQKREKMQALRQSTQEQVHALLTPEQQAKAKELRAQHEKHGRPGDKPRGEKPPGD